MRPFSRFLHISHICSRKTSPVPRHCLVLGLQFKTSTFGSVGVFRGRDSTPGAGWGLTPNLGSGPGGHGALGAGITCCSLSIDRICHTSQA